MANGLDQDITQWKTVKQQAVAGEFKMEEAIGEALRTACANYVTKLERLQVAAKGLEHISGFGGIPSADVLKQKFQSKAVNGEGGDSALKRLEQHIEIAGLMRDTYAAAIGKFKETDQQRAAELNNK
ncbi:hypothetical protein [Nocardia sp. NPDC058705]|uniref:hypothetical protein n=1 Tax=Nocardia sp. NPDC058705 TaxID=3346609 RepID=UPI00367B363D